MLRWDTAVSCVCLASVTQHPQFTTLKQEGIKTGIRTDLSYPPKDYEALSSAATLRPRGMLTSSLDQKTESEIDSWCQRGHICSGAIMNRKSGLVDDFLCIGAEIVIFYTRRLSRRFTGSLAVAPPLVFTIVKGWNRCLQCCAIDRQCCTM